MSEESTNDPPEEPQAPVGADSEPPAAESGQATGAPPPYAPSEAVSGLVESESGPPPEVLVGAAFAGGLALALILRRITS
ncbi:MAG TPA: hypothetical protein VHI73_03765 [Solirubrobacteraceae bacterium]|nr:hypothetical protein [Solirubrobacteraceae bacterium]